MDAYKRHWHYKKPLDVKNLAEEVGDILWYLVLAHKALDYPLIEEADKAIAELTQPSLDLILAKLVRYSSNIFSVSFAYPEQAMDSGLEHDLRHLNIFLAFLVRELDFDTLTCAKFNIEKLSKRYPEGFTEFAAVNRNTEHELSHITLEAPSNGTETGNDTDGK